MHVICGSNSDKAKKEAREGTDQVARFFDCCGTSLESFQKIEERADNIQFTFDSPKISNPEIPH